MGKAAGCERSPAQGPSLLSLQGPPTSLCLLTHSPPVSSGANGQTFPSSPAATLLASTPGRPRLTRVHQLAVPGRQARWDVRVSHISPRQRPHRSSVWVSKGSAARSGPSGTSPSSGGESVCFQPVVLCAQINAICKSCLSGASDTYSCSVCHPESSRVCMPKGTW